MATNELYWLKRQIEQGVPRISGRIYPGHLPQRQGGPTVPAVAYSLISKVRTTSKAGNTGLSDPRVQVRCVDTSHSRAHLLADEVEAVLRNRAAIYQGVKIYRVRCLDETEDYDDELKLWSVILDFSLEISQ